MKNKPANRRAFAALIPAIALLATPGLAQEMQPATPPQTAPPIEAVAPPPVVPTIPAPVAAAPAPATITAPTAVAPPPAEPTATAVSEPAVPTVSEPDATPARARVVRAERAVRPTRERAPVEPTRVAEPATVAVTPAPSAATVTPAPVAQAPVETAAPAPAAPVSTTQTSTEAQAAPIWPWLLGGLLIVLGALGLLVSRRRRAVAEDDSYEEVYVEEPVLEAAPIRNEPTPFAPDPEPQFLRTAPIATASDEPAPVAAEDAALARPEADEVASLTEGDAPVADRPWLEFSLRPVRAGTNVDEALVEIELTVGNSGSVAAEDVRISTFMFASEPANDAEMERMLIERGNDGVPPVTIKPGEGTRVDATLALSKAGLIENTSGSILPIIMAEARYRLSDGSEGRTSASFTIGVSEEGEPAMSPIQLNERAMHDGVEARLRGVPEHA